MNPMHLSGRLCVSLLFVLAACQTPAATKTTVTTLPHTAVPPAPTVTPGTVIGTTSMGFFPEGVTAGAGSLWYWASSAGAVARVDPATGQVLATIPIGDPNKAQFGTPTGLAIEGQNTWVTDNIGHALVRIDPATNMISERIPLGTVTSGGLVEPVAPFGLATDGDSLWVSDFLHGLVLRVDTHSQQVIAMIKVAYPTGVAAGAGAIWAVQHRKSSLVRIDPATNAVVATIALPGHTTNLTCGLCVEAVAVGPEGVWVPLNLGKGVARIDPQTNTIAAVIPFKVSVLAVGLSGGSVWAPEGMPELADCKAPAGARPEQCGPADSKQLFANSDCAMSPGFVARIDPGTNTVVDRFAVTCPLSAIVSGGSLWVGSGGDPIYPDMKGWPASLLRLALGQ